MFEVKEPLTVDNILKEVTDFQIFQCYCHNFKEIDIKFKSELRNDPRPSCNITYYKGKLWYKDFGDSDNKACDCITYVMRKYNISFAEALETINKDLNLGLQSYQKVKRNFNKVLTKVEESIIPKDTETVIKPIKRNWLTIDTNYWHSKYYLTIPRLEFFNIFPIGKLIINSKTIYTRLDTYSYLIDIEDKFEFYKIYSPYDTAFKWINNCKAHHYQGMNQLPWSHENLVITKSLKDVAVLSLFKIPAIAPQSESQVPTPDVIDRLSKRFNNIYVFYDNDSAGIKGAGKVASKYGIPNISIPTSSGVKDISDYIERYRYTKTKEFIKDLIK